VEGRRRNMKGYVEEGVERIEKKVENRSKICRNGKFDHIVNRLS